MCVSIKYRNYLSLFYSCCCHHSGKWPNLLLWQLKKSGNWHPCITGFQLPLFSKILANFFFLCEKYFLNILHLLQPHLQLQQLPHLQLHHEGCLVSSRFEAPTKAPIYPAGLDNLFLLILYNKGKNLFTH